ncbi:MAG: protein translocase subunit SecF [Candidatus Berkelbacteria bacterium]
MLKIVRRYKVWFTLSIVMAVVAIAAISFFGLRMGIDYKGGTIIEFSTGSSNATEITKNVLNEQSYSGYQIKTSTGTNYILRMENISSDAHQKIAKAMTAQMPDYKEISYDNVGPTIGKDLTNKSILAVIIASLAIILFVAFSFRKIPKPLSPWIFGICAIIALLHDLLITIGFVAIMGHFFTWMEVDALFITALLTIMGFSVHDTIVVYDRLRENFIKNPHADIELVAEESTNQTFARSINTSLTTVIVLIAMLFFGSQSIQHFVAVLAFGIILGTYSSIFNATPLVVVWHKALFKKKRTS